MTNETIIFNNRVTLMTEGIIKGTGRIITVESENGEKIQLEEPEELHTYQGWQAMKRQVKKGEKAIATMRIWKRTVRKKADEEEPQENMFMTDAFFFTEAQTEAM